MSNYRSPLVVALFIFVPALFFYSCKDTSGWYPSSPYPSITALTCSSAVISKNAKNGVAYVGTAIIPYTGGNAANYSKDSIAVLSSGVTGLTATLAAGTLASGNGNLTYNISGTPSASGNAQFAINFHGRTCSFSLIVN